MHIICRSGELNCLLNTGPGARDTGPMRKSWIAWIVVVALLPSVVRPEGTESEGRGSASSGLTFQATIATSLVVTVDIEPDPAGERYATLRTRVSYSGLDDVTVTPAVASETAIAWIAPPIYVASTGRLALPQRPQSARSEVIETFRVAVGPRSVGAGVVTFVATGL